MSARIHEDLVSIVIPAHNEGAVIDRCLTALTRQKGAHRLEILVVCNGCRDDTAARARRFGDAIRVIETDVASKSNALNLGDQAASSFPRIYLDADVELGPGTIEALIAALGTNEPRVAVPRVSIDLGECSFPVRAFYRVWKRLPYLAAGHGGGGIYAISRGGRERFGRFPTLTADDGFVQRHFRGDERVCLQDHWVRVTPPAAMKQLMAIKTRSHFGTLELEARFPSLRSEPSASHVPRLVKLSLNPLNWPALALYAYVKVVSRARARRRWRTGDHHRWERDESSRVAAG
jgi:glycosyltransferase involved in cell wall biosynthesis